MAATCDSQAIRDRMHRIRERMNVEVEDLKDDAQKLLDWKSYVASAPWISLGAAALVGFWLVPGHRYTPTVKLDERSVERVVEKNVERQQPKQRRQTWFASLVSVAGSFAVKTAWDYASRNMLPQLAQGFMAHGQTTPHPYQEARR